MRPTTLLCSLAFLSALHAEDFPKPFNTEKGDPMPAEEVARTMALPKGFKCVVFAAEPDVQQPIAMSWDKKGRLWVAENYTYAENPMRWDTKLRDRIIILEDKDGDGKHDGRKVFWEGGAYLTSVETGYGGVWVLHNGTLSFIADKNGDDIPDGEPEILLDGFNVKTIGHNIVNGLRWGPDGWLYGRHGITDTSSVGAPGTPADKRVRMNCAIWRYHPTLKILETVAHGGTNSWGHDWNANGDLFMINTVIGHLWHIIPGAYYRRMFGTHLNPHVYEIIEQTADHFHWDNGSEKWDTIRKGGASAKTAELGGGHAHVGMLIYQGGLWPKEYEGAVLTCNLHGNRINMDTLERQGCGYVGKHAPDFMQAQDKWFRGIDLLTCPDGNVIVSDWSDSGECHDNDGVHRTSGRIYKIVYGEPKKAEPINVAAMKDEELVKLLESPNNWWSRMAANRLLERNVAESTIADEGRESLHEAIGRVGELAAKGKDSISATRAAWLLLAIGKFENQELLNNLYLPRGNKWENDEHHQAVRIASDTQLLLASLVAATSSPDWRPDAKETFQAGLKSSLLELHRIATDASSGLVRLQIASTLQRLPLESRWPIATALANHKEDATDRQQPLMIWYGIEPAVAADPMKGVKLISEAKLPTVRRLVARRIAEMIESKPEGVDALVALMLEGRSDDLIIDILEGMGAGLDGFSSAKKPKDWDILAPAIHKDGTEKSMKLARDLSVVFGSGRASDELIVIVKNAEGDANARLNAFKSLTRTAKPELLPVIRGLINDKVLGTVSRSALAAYDDPGIPKAMLSPWPVRSEEQQAATVATLTTRPAYAKALLEAIKARKIPTTVLSPFQARQIRSLGDESLNTLLTEAWGEIRDTPEAKKAEFTKWEGLLTADTIAKADPAKGRMIFMATCSACHKLYGQGGAIGPELTGSDRHNLKYLLENILDPSAVVPADFRVSILNLKDGRTLSGVIPEQTERTLTVQTPAERITIERSQIEKQQQLPVSLMPEGLLSALGDENVKNLIAYLMSNSQVEMPK